MQSDNFVRRQPTNHSAITDFDLQGCVTDVKALGKTVCHFDQKCVTRMASGNQQVHRQRDFSCTHAPDVQIMHLAHPCLRGQKITDLYHIDLHRYGM